MSETALDGSAPQHADADQHEDRRALTTRRRNRQKPSGPSKSIAIAPRRGPMVTPVAQEKSRVPTVETI